MTTFHAGDLVSATTGLLISPTGIDGVYRILNHLTGDNLMTHQLPRAAETAAPHLLAAHPWLAGLDIPEPGQPAEVYREFLARVVAEHSEQHEVSPLPPGVWEHKNPLVELAEMAPNAQIVAVHLPEPAEEVAR